MLNLCKYKDIFGLPNKGLHSYRFMNIAIVDVFFVLVAGFFIKKYYPNYKLYEIYIILFLIGIITHKIFCVDTALNKLIFNLF